MAAEAAANPNANAERRSIFFIPSSLVAFLLVFARYRICQDKVVSRVCFLGIETPRPSSSLTTRVFIRHLSSLKGVREPEKSRSSGLGRNGSAGPARAGRHGAPKGGSP